METLSEELLELENKADEKAELFATTEKWNKLTFGQKKLLSLLVDEGGYSGFEDAAYKLRTSLQWVHKHAIGLSAMGLARRELSCNQIWLNQS